MMMKQGKMVLENEEGAHGSNSGSSGGGKLSRWEVAVVVGVLNLLMVVFRQGGVTAMVMVVLAIDALITNILHHTTLPPPPHKALAGPFTRLLSLLTPYSTTTTTTTTTTPHHHHQYNSSVVSSTSPLSGLASRSASDVGLKHEVRFQIPKVPTRMPPIGEE